MPRPRTKGLALPGPLTEGTATESLLVMGSDEVTAPGRSKFGTSILSVSSYARSLTDVDIVVDRSVTVLNASKSSDDDADILSEVFFGVFFVVDVVEVEGTR